MGIRSRHSVAGAQFGLTISSSVISLTVPDVKKGAFVAEIFVRDAAINFTREGTAPTTTKGTTAYPDDIILLNSQHEINNVKMIATGSDASVDVEYFSDISG